MIDESEEDSFSRDCISAQKAGNQALETARSSVQVCAHQEEQLRTSSRHLQHHQSIIDRSTRIVRGMTWGGWLYNLVIDPHIMSPSENVNTSMSHTKLDVPQEKTIHSTNSISPSFIRDKSSLSFQDQHLATLSSQLEELQSISSTITSSIRQQNTTLDTLTQQTDDLMEQEKMLVRRISQWTHPTRHVFSTLSSSSSSSSSSYIKIMIQHVQSQRFLTLQGTTVVIQQNSTQPSIFHLYRVSSSFSSSSYSSVSNGISLLDTSKTTSRMIGLQYERTRTWLGYSKLFGSLCCSSTIWGIREQWEMEENDILDSPTRLLSVAANWGNGGWLQVHETDFSLSIGGGYQTEYKNKAALFQFIPI